MFYQSNVIRYKIGCFQCFITGGEQKPVLHQIGKVLFVPASSSVVVHFEKFGLHVTLPQIPIFLIGFFQFVISHSIYNKMLSPLLESNQNNVTRQWGIFNSLLCSAVSHLFNALPPYPLECRRGFLQVSHTYMHLRCMLLLSNFYHIFATLWCKIFDINFTTMQR